MTTAYRADLDASLHFCFRVGGISVSVEAEVMLSGLDIIAARGFAIDAAPADVSMKFLAVPAEDLVLPLPDPIERIALLAASSNGHDFVLTSDFYRSRIVRQHLLDHLFHCHDGLLQLNGPAASSYDFARSHATLLCYPTVIRFFKNPQILLLVLAAFLHRFSAGVVHACGVVRNGKTALFIAPSGGGKTTIAGLSCGSPVLSDDRVVIRRHGGVFVAHGTPWGQITVGPESAPIGGIFVLEKSERFSIERIGRHEVLRVLYDDPLHERIAASRQSREQTFDLLRDLVTAVPTYLMRFPRDNVIWDDIDRALST